MLILGIKGLGLKRGPLIEKYINYLAGSSQWEAAWLSG